MTNATRVEAVPGEVHLNAADVRFIGDLLNSTMQLGTAPSDDFVLPQIGGSGPVYMAFRFEGKKEFECWTHEVNQAESIRTAMAKFFSSGEEQRVIDTIELCLCYGVRDVDLLDEEQVTLLSANVLRGIMGTELGLVGNEKAMVRVAPTQTIATNRRFEKVLKQFRDDHQVSDQDINDGAVRVRQFAASQLLVRQGNTPDRSEGTERAEPIVKRLFRGAPLVSERSVDRESVEMLESLLSQYLIRSVRPDGRMRYLYYPSRGREDRSRNNQIRQWMATTALGRVSRRRGDAETANLAERNLRYNLRHFYREENGLGLIDDRGKVKLGAVAIALMAIHESPHRVLHKRVESHLMRTIDYLWQDSGAFKTFLYPAERNDLHNFYPGEALLAWAFDYAESPQELRRDRFLKSFEYYRRWHRENQNPAFVPWHTQAYVAMSTQVDAEELGEFVFEMNDWLLSVQQWDDAPALDCRGRFYAPSHPFGPPHASATGVYLEGLIDAFQLARKVGDLSRLEAYRRAILRGLRSVLQLTFKDDADLFYVNKKSTLRGGMRTTVYDNVVRIDNVQHSLMAIQKILEFFGESDFQCDDHKHGVTE